MSAIDIETYSSNDITKCGVYAYAEAEDFTILLFAYAYDNEEIKIIDLACGEKLPQNIIDDLTNPKIIKTAFNANFERTCLAKYLNKLMSPDQWRCSAVHSLELGLPTSFDKVAKCMNLDQQKMNEGKALIRYFSMPCKPTKANGSRTRNLPEDNIEKWNIFKNYCRQDVEVERAIRKKLERFPVTEKEWKLWVLDQKINDSGVKIDKLLAQNAIKCDKAYQDKKIEEAINLTGLQNPNSPSQLKEWLESKGVKVKSLSKEKVKELLEEVEDETVKKVLKLRKDLSKTSVKKYQAMKRAMCKDERIRGLMKFYGASRTGRWAGKLVQTQNLPRNSMDNLRYARELLKAGDFEMLEILFDSVPDVLSQLIRTAFIPSENSRFIVSDFSAIEARVIAWLAGEKWVIDTFKSSGKIYEMTASRMFGVPIENITLEHKVWDGENFVSHEGLIYRGVKEVITYEGLTATEDHFVWVEGKSKPVRFGYAATSRAHLLFTGDGRKAIRMGEEIQKRIDELEITATSCTARLTGMPHASGVLDKIGKYTAEIVDLKSLLDLNLKKCFYELNRLNRYINSVNNSEMRLILSLRYINGLEWDQVAASISPYASGDSVRKAHDRFLRKNKIS
ncbi:DNA polymerase [Haloimpatiens sp. FM7315]|uniref:DNA polymerase n=1 Tax=Haloimpatiens sp. FM7315 TaxID=3298609 RepID=UPI0035A365D6